MATILPATSDDPRDVIHQAVQALVAGQLVALPTETVYVVSASGLNPEAVKRLEALIADEAVGHETLALRNADESLDYVPQITPLGRKLIRRCWPGPVTLLFQTDAGEGLLQSLPAGTQSLITRRGVLPLRVAAHPVVADVLNLMPSPLVITPEQFAAERCYTTAEDIAEAFGDRVDLIVDDGPSRYAAPATSVQVNDRWKIVSPGVVTESVLHRLSSEFYLFVCTGNTCRSPMAEALFRRILANKLQCTEDELADRGFMAASAGLAAALGATASPETIEVLRQDGIDLRSHESQPLTGRLLDQADYVFTMTNMHRETILQERPELADRVQLLSPEGSDIIDPIGRGMSVYQNCKAEIERSIEAILPQTKTAK